MSNEEEQNFFPKRPTGFNPNVDNLIVKSYIQIYLDSFIDRKKLYYGLRLLIRGFLRSCLESQDADEIDALVEDLEVLKKVLKQELQEPSKGVDAFTLKEKFQITDRLIWHFHKSAQDTYNRGYYEQASAGFLVLACLDPFNEAAWLSLGISEQRLDNYSHALEAYKVAQKVNPCNPAGNIYQAQCHVKLENIVAAEQHLSNAMQSLWWNQTPDLYRQQIHRLHKHIANIKS